MSFRKYIGVWVGVLVLVTSGGRSAASQPGPAAAPPVQTATATQPPQDGEPAKLHYEKATAAYALGNFNEAAASYERAFELKPDPALLYNAAQAHRRSGNRPRAIALYRSYLQVFPRAENRDLAQRHLRELERAPNPAPPLPPTALAPSPTPSPASAVSTRSAPPASERRAFWKRPWVWVAAGAAAVVATSVTAMALSGKVDPRPSWGQVGP